MNVRLVVFREGRKTGPVFPLHKDRVTLGRSTACDIRIPSAEVSRKHCRLTWRNEHLTAEDLDSANGTLLNGAPLTQAQVLQSGDCLEVGPIAFLVEYGAPLEVEALDEADLVEDDYDVEPVPFEEDERIPVEDRYKLGFHPPPPPPVAESAPIPLFGERPPPPAPAREVEDLDADELKGGDSDDEDWNLSDSGTDLRSLLEGLEEDSPKRPGGKKGGGKKKKKGK